ncbi:uncharacterized protein LOC113396058 [Vanessa tameamea]|uniref:Uncharacterized protein LOC113396058 n=1 Tax=Vanessa tameamea TaxID=334116 RepID=A0ABM4ARR7_VANTA
MKFSLTFLTLVALSYSAPQPRKLFHEHFEDFKEVISKEVDHELKYLVEHYLEFEEFRASLDYIGSDDFKKLIFKMEELPEFEAVVDFLESNNLDMQYFLDAFSTNLEYVQRGNLRHEVSGRDMSSLIRDCTNIYPKAKLAALYEEKLAEDDDFRRAMESFETEEWDKLYTALWANETFLKEVETLKENGIEVSYKMKVAIAFLALVAVACSAPQPRVLFHEHFEEFSRLIGDEAADDLNHLVEHYLEFEEFQMSLDYLITPNFRNLVYEMEDLPEFKAVVEYLETHYIDINYFINAINNFVDDVQRRTLRHEVSGRDMSSFIKDSIDAFPKAKLTALYEQKMAEDDLFRNAMESFETEEWKELYSALWQNETFLKEVEILKENGIDVEIVLLEAQAVLGIY